MPAGKILIIRGGAIGDFILTLPVFSALRKTFPNVRLELLGYPRVNRLAVAARAVDDAQSIDSKRLAAFFADRGELAGEWRDYFSEFDLIISFLYDPDGIFRQNIARCSSAQYLAGPHRPDEKCSMHAAEWNLKVLETLAIFGADPMPRLELEAGAGDLLGPGLWLAVHPGSGSSRKNWGENNWAELLPRLARHSKANLLLIGGEAEGDRLERLGALWPGQRLRLARSLPLEQLARQLQQAEFYLGHDSGISHLAGALGVKGMIWWGPSNPAIWRPPQPQMHIFCPARGLESVSVEEAWPVVKAAWETWAG